MWLGVTLAVVLSIAVGVGLDLVERSSFGLTAQRPPLLRDLRRLPADALDPRTSGGDLSLQACADDPQVAYHVVRDLTRIAKDSGAAATRWAVLGFGRASAGAGQTTRATCSGSGTAPATSASPRTSTGSGGSPTGPPGSAGAPTRSFARSRCGSRTGTPTGSATRTGCSAGTRSPARR
jgi:hypothetical protein